MRVIVLSVLLFALAGERSSVPLGLDLYRPVPEVNPLTPEKIALGRRLFFDRRLSRDRTIACADCHDPKRTFTDGRPVAVGIEGRRGDRNAPTLINRVYGQSQFWDGRAESLERQALEPILNPKEMDMTMVEVLARVRRDASYAAQFQSVFHQEPTQETLAMALASYLRIILSGAAPYDRYINGDRNALSQQAKRGLHLFRGKANCWACHVGPTFTDERFHNTGVAWRDPSTGSGQAGEFQDIGRGAVTGRPEDEGAFKTPTLREVARTAPYMHDGSLATLEDVVEFYNTGGRPNSNLDPEIRPLDLTVEEKQTLVAFLRSLSGTIREGVR